ncbi:hypothetical protein GH714_025170 [Hevea brasiliensis]|uniref:Uncharacterized protein n=1 Tax=Hevea brasiliensis TaxID=3981 RepID=A0A6A6MQV7_HEVBR|nr:hypothetical protein GH714_025170 [Hevea brasiliensis]
MARVSTTGMFLLIFRGRFGEVNARGISFYNNIIDKLLLRGVLDPIAYGDYPPEMRHYLGSELPRFSQEEISTVKESIDIIGINHYTALHSKDCIHSACIPGRDYPVRGFVYATGERDGVSNWRPDCKSKVLYSSKRTGEEY